MRASNPPDATRDPTRRSKRRSKRQKHQEIRRVHRQHLEIIRHIQDLSDRLIDANGPTRQGQGHFDVAGRLARLQEELAVHFADEERVGFVPRALARAPHLADRAQRIVSQHDLLRLGLFRVIATLALEHSTWDEVQLDFESFILALREHERRENELIREALMDDLGGSG